MFKKLRNRLLIVNTIIIAALILASFSVIYIVTSQNVQRGVEQKLDRAVGFGRAERMIKQKDNKRPPDDNSVMQNVPPDEPEKQPFTLTFTVITDKEGNIETVNMPFELGEDFYSGKIHDIIFGSSDSGRIKSETGFWAYILRSTETGYAVAFTDIQAEHAMMRNLFLILLFVGIIALTAAFLVSLFSANRSIRPVEESYNKQKQFVADASHELKTPLTTINTNIDVLLSHRESAIGEEEKWLGYIKNEAERMTKLTNDLLYLARLDHDDGGAIMSRVSFSDATESIILIMEAVVYEKGLNLTYDISPDLYVLGSAEQLKQLVMILMDNAVKYTPKSGNIDVSLKRESSDAVFRIRNSGEGIDEESQKQIFERFYRSDKSRSRESGGYGLGLAIAKAIVSSAKGSIKANSRKNEYTEFTVKIPLVK